MAVPSVFRLFYLAFRMGPFIVVLYFMLSALLNQDYTNIIYLMGVIMACFFGILTGGLWTSRIAEAPETVCHPLRLGTGERLSVLPLSTVVYVYTLCYFSVPIFQKKTQSENAFFLTAFVLLIFFDLLWLWMFSCSSMFRMVVAGTVGITVGLSWGQIVYELNLTSFFSQGRDNSCLLHTPVATPDPSSGEPTPKYICVRRQRTEYIPAAKEGLTNMTTTPVSNGSSPAPSHRTTSFSSRKTTSSPASLTISPQMMKLLATAPAPPPATSPPPPIIVADVQNMCTQSSQIIAKMLSGLTGQENQPYVADLYDNLTFHQKNVSTLLTALNSETSASITDAKRMDYYRKYDATMQQNIQQSIQQLQSVQTNMDPTLYATFLTTFQSLQKQYNQLPT